ncbi:MAG: flavin reductase family protein [Lachnospiraceae bacterium]|nr:flavin reductase family protein [Lachnospiraceae bacterium]
MKRKSVEPIYSMCVQPSFIIGTYNEDGSCNFAPITWVSATCKGGDDYMLVISMYGSKRTRENVIRNRMFSANLVNTSMLPLMDYFGTKHSVDEHVQEPEYGVSCGEVLDVPTLDDSPWVYECEVAKAVEAGESVTFFCPIRNIQMDEKLNCTDTFDVDLTVLDPVIYSGRYHSLGRSLGKIGDFREKTMEKSEEREEILSKFHLHRMLMFILAGIALLLCFIGGMVAVHDITILVIGGILFLASVLYGFFSGAMFCPFCGQIISRQGFGEHCKYCGEKIF